MSCAGTGVDSARLAKPKVARFVYSPPSQVRHRRVYKCKRMPVSNEIVSEYVCVRAHCAARGNGSPRMINELSIFEHMLYGTPYARQARTAKNIYQKSKTKFKINVLLMGKSDST